MHDKSDSQPTHTPQSTQNIQNSLHTQQHRWYNVKNHATWSGRQNRHLLTLEVLFWSKLVCSMCSCLTTSNSNSIYTIYQPAIASAFFIRFHPPHLHFKDMLSSSISPLLWKTAHWPEKIHSSIPSKPTPTSSVPPSFVWMCDCFQILSKTVSY